MWSRGGRTWKPWKSPRNFEVFHEIATKHPCFLGAAKVWWGRCLRFKLIGKDEDFVEILRVKMENHFECKAFQDCEFWCTMLIFTCHAQVLYGSLFFRCFFQLPCAKPMLSTRQLMHPFCQVRWRTLRTLSRWKLPVAHRAVKNWFPSTTPCSRNTVVDPAMFLETQQDEVW